MEMVVTKPKFRLIDGVVGGFLAGLGMAAVFMLGSLLIGRSVTYPLALIGHAFQSYSAVPDMSGNVVMRGLLIHLSMSVISGLIFSAIASLFPRVRNLWLWGTLYAVAIWGIDQMGALRALDPTMAVHFNQVLFLISHVVYGAVLGAYVEARYRKEFGVEKRYVREASLEERRRRDAVVDATRRTKIPVDTTYKREVPVDTTYKREVPVDTEYVDEEIEIKYRKKREEEPEEIIP
jgi:hypothetical protein